MRIGGIMAVCLAFALLARGEDAPAPEKRVVLCPIKGEIGDGTAAIVRRAVKEAENADALYLIVDTPGGLLDAGIDITNTLLSAKCKTVAFVTGMGAISAGALVSYACDEIVMTRGASIGASTPISPAGDLGPDVNEKTKSFLRAKFRSLGEAKGHDPFLGEAMVDAAVALRRFKDETGTYRIGPASGEGTSLKEEVVSPPATTDPAKLVRELSQQLVGAAAPERETQTAAPETPREEAAWTTLPDGSELIDPAGKLLTLTTLEAQHLGLSAATVGSIDEAIARQGLENAARETIVPTAAERFYIFLTNPVVAGLLFMIGLAGIYAELKAPGLSLPGAVGVVCLGLFFGAHMVLGLSDWFDIVLVALGLLLILAEIFVVQGTMVPGALGLGLVLVGLYLSITRVPVPEYAWDYVRLNGALQTMITTGLSFIAFVFVFWKVFPHTPFPKFLVQSATQPVEQGFTVQTAAEAHAYLGHTGVAETMLRPAGRARIGGHLLDVVTRGEFIAPGAPVRVLQADGNRYVVEAIGEDGGHERA